MPTDRVSLKTPPARILLIRPSALGDVCRSTPVLASLRQAFPAARIDWVVHEAFAGAIDAHPALTDKIIFRRGTLGRWYTPQGWSAARDLVARVRGKGIGGRYDLAIDCQGLARSGLLAWLSGAPVRVGHADAREGATWAYTHAIDPGKAVHAVDRMLTLVSALETGGERVQAVADARLYPHPSEVGWVQAEPRLAGGYAVLAPTTRWPGKRWPIDRFLALAERLAGQGVDAIAVVGAAGERAECLPLLERAGPLPIVDLVGATSVARLLAVVSRARLVVASDSAVLHMAVGCSRPLVALFGPTDVSRVGPFGRAGDVIQHLDPGERLDHKDQAAGARLMARITVEEVWARCLLALG